MTNWLIVNFAMNLLIYLALAVADPKPWGQKDHTAHAAVSTWAGLGFSILLEQLFKGLTS